MSSKNGDKARHHRLRKKFIARRLMVRELQEKLALASAPPAEVSKTKPHEG
ncbi:MAG TPA: hypothetical protein VGG72_24850 [Bryobacteraceae bacterium]|jgi:hypothetical protein